MASGAILLALLSSFVTKAVTQFFRDNKERQRTLDENYEVASAKSDGTYEAADDEMSSAPSRGIHPVPTLFSDTYRWTLQSEDKKDSRKSEIEEREKREKRER